MSIHLQSQQPSAVPPPASTPAEARKLADGLLIVMSALLGLIENETELVRAGKIREGMALEAKKAELSRSYVNVIAQFKNSQKYLTRATPELLGALHRHHDIFRAMLQINLTVLATAHKVSEGVIRGVNADVQRRNAPQTYTANGQRAAPGRQHATPIAVSRSL